jgi:hypothetical protein
MRNLIFGTLPKKYCKFCARRIHWAATVCPHCTRDIDTPEHIQERTRAFKRQRRISALIFGLVIIVVWVAYSFSRPP